MAVDVKGVLLEMGEENAKIVLSQIVKPLLLEKAAQAAPSMLPLIQSVLDQLEAEGLKLVDKINPADNPPPAA